MAVKAKRKPITAKRKPVKAKRRPTVSTRKAAAKAVSLHVGLNTVDPAHYGGWSGPLAACEFDAHDMAAVAAAKQMQSTVLLTPEATRRRVLAGIRGAAKRLKSGDFFFLSYSGHGGQLPDVTGEEDDKQDETWCLFDGQLIDDELYFELGRFKKGVRILVLSDSCHSGTVVRAAPPFGMTASQGRSKLMPPDVGRRTYDANKTFYDRLQRSIAKAAGGERTIDPDTALAELAVSPRLVAVTAKFKPMLILISGCQDNQTSMDGDRNGAFTQRLKEVWGDGAFGANYARFHATIKSGMPTSQTPNLFVLGPAGAFLTERPFQV